MLNIIYKGKMKKLLLVMLLSFAFSANAEFSPIRECELREDLAYHIMLGRQLGDSKEDQIVLAQTIADYSVKRLNLSMIDLAHSFPIAGTDTGKQNIARKFAADYYTRCAKQMLRYLQ